MMTDLVFHEEFVKHKLSPGHPESPERLVVAMDEVERAGILSSDEVNLLKPKAANIGSIEPIHSETYLRKVKEMSESGGGYFTLDTSVNRNTFSAALLAAGGGIETVDRIAHGAAENGFVLCRPPGHHAEYNRALGFCFINNIAVAANYLISQQEIERILIVDYDAHHGNGTQNAFYNRDDVYYVGIHQDGRTLFPGTGFLHERGNKRGEGFNLNLPMYPGSGDVSYELVFREVVKPIASGYSPDFVLVSSGFDCHFADHLTSLSLTTSGIAKMNKSLNEIAKEFCDGRIAFFLEGGYNLDIMRHASLNLIEELAGVPITMHDDEIQEDPLAVEKARQLIDNVGS